jgi:hypothetical protein
MTVYSQNDVSRLQQGFVLFSELSACFSFSSESRCCNNGADMWAAITMDRAWKASWCKRDRTFHWRSSDIWALRGPALSARGEHVHFHKLTVGKKLQELFDTLSEDKFKEYAIYWDETNHINLLLKEKVPFLDVIYLPRFFFFFFFFFNIFKT